MKTAFLFPGQGAQVVGMGKEIADTFAPAAEIFSRANDVVGFDLRSICFEGPADKLNTTTMSQPAIFVLSAAILEVLKTNSATSEIQADVTAGLSLGEYTALYAAGVVSFEDGLRLVQKRGQAMQQAAEADDGGMVSIIGLDEEKVDQLCQEAGENEILAGVNYNCPGQIVVSGNKSACERVALIAEKYGAIKAIPLAVAGAFHTEMMSSAADALKKALASCDIKNPGDVNIIANINAEYYKNSDEIKDGLAKQLTSPILWQKCMERFLSDGVEHFYEIGPGKVLTSLMRRINRKIKVVNLSSLASIRKLLES